MPAYAHVHKNTLAALPYCSYKSFVEETLKTTSAWTRYIINDRDQALRPFGETRNVAQIDKVS